MTRDADRFGDAEWKDAARSETPTMRLDRNWDDLLQELRVAQTGVQLLTGLLLTVPFRSRFLDLVPQQLAVYLIGHGDLDDPNGSADDPSTGSPTATTTDP